ncbi:MAG: hypothetical protein COW23_01670, partial [Hydrogenophilales bacterium CG15_BIG_FIL_POST_REV_8_21_14_020_62_31]
ESLHLVDVCDNRISTIQTKPIENPSFLLVGPYDPKGGEYTFLAPPLGVWRLAGVLEAAGFRVSVFDPNCCDGVTEEAFDKVLQGESLDVVGFSITGMTLPYDLALAYRARKSLPHAVLVTGGVEATFNPREVFKLGPFDLVVLGEGEGPLLEIGRRLWDGAGLQEIPGTARVAGDGSMRILPHRVMTREEMKEATFLVPYERMPFRAYWKRLDERFRLDDISDLAERETRLAEVRAVRLMTSNYCPMNCTFCSYTNFLAEAQCGERAPLVRLNAEETLEMLFKITSHYPEVRTVIFQDDIFILKNDNRIFPLCEQIISAKQQGRLPMELSFISSNRIDAMTPERLQIIKRAGFRILGFGIENFSLKILKEFNKEKIYPYITPMLEEALRLGITPFIDLILTSPHCTLEDYAETIRKAYYWMEKGCEVGMYPYVIPFSGSVMSRDPDLVANIVRRHQKVAGSTVEWDQPAVIVPKDAAMLEALVLIENNSKKWLDDLSELKLHLPSRLRSLLWVICSIPVLEGAGYKMPALGEVVDIMLLRLTGLKPEEKENLRRKLMATARWAQWRAGDEK